MKDLSIAFFLFRKFRKSQEQLQEGPKHPLLKYKRGSIDNAAFDQRLQEQVSV